ncbi:class I SAM-dependent methyltransferase [Helicobacter rodentium]|uniref:class I SAM-dependent methyltransferase n=1 Tax=Helicobacter rodentium TaxID=59617 RepID=UPI0030810EBA
MLNKDIVGTEMLQDAENSQEMWENIFRNKEWGKYPPESVIRFIARNFYHKNRDEIHILELGIGTGANLWFCAREGFKVSGCEFSQSGVDRFIQRMQNENLQDKIMQIEVGDYLETLDDLQFKFNCILDVYSLAYNDFEKTKIIIEKSMNKMLTGGDFIVNYSYI